MHLRRLAIQIAGLAVPMLALALIHWQLDRSAVAAVERFVDVEHRLHRVVAGGNLAQDFTRITERSSIDHRATRAIHIHAEHLLRAQAFADSVARFAVGGGNDQHHMAIHRLGPRNFKAQRRLRLGEERGGKQQQSGGETHGTSVTQRSAPECFGGQTCETWDGSPSARFSAGVQGSRD